MGRADWPFVGTETQAAGRVTRHELRSKYEAVYRNVYVPKGQALTPVTKAARTAFDIGRRRGLTTAIIRLDALLRATGVKADEVQALADRHQGARGVVQLRKALELADGGAESPQETRTRLLLIRARLPQPTTQIEVFDRFGYFVARLDMGWDDWKVGVEFDGAQHWTDPQQRARDIDRLAELESLGWRIVRVSGYMLRYHPQTFVNRTFDALQAAGWRPSVDS